MIHLKRLNSYSFLVAALLWLRPPIPAVVLGDMIVWNNQDQLDGQLLGFDDGHLVWESSLFKAPFRVNADVISHVLMGVDKTKSSDTGQFRVESKFGDVLFGDMISLSDSILELQSPRFGKVLVRRNAIREIRQLKHNQVVYDGPRWLEDWRVLKVGRDINEWEATDMGFLTTKKYGGEIFHELPMLDQAEIHLAVSWDGKPGFQIDLSPAADLLGVRAKPKLSIKSWGTDIVAQSATAATSFVPLMKLDRKTSELRLRIVWDNRNRKATVFSSDSRKLADVPVNKLANQFGVLIKNRSDNLTVERVRLSKWNGSTYSDDREPGNAYVRLADGRLLDGEISTLEKGDSELPLASGESIKLQDLAIAEFNPDAANAYEPARLRFADGTVLSGTLVAMDRETLHVESGILLQPVQGKRQGMTGVRFYQGRTLEFDFELLSDGRRLSGNLGATPDTGRLGWASVGAPTPSTLAASTTYTLERRLADGPSSALPAGEILYLKDGSVVIGEVHRMEKEALVMSTAFAAPRAIPFTSIRALEMIRGSGRASFTDASWRFLQETQPDQRSPDLLSVSKTVSLQNQDLFHGGKVTMNCQWEDGFVGLLTVQLGDSAKHVVRCSFTRNSLSARCLVNAASSVKLPTIPDRRASISIEADDSRLSVWVNGILASSAETGRPISGTGLWIQTGSAINRRESGNLKSTPRLTLGRLRVGDNASRLGAGFAAAEELAMLLKVPRNKRKNAPQHILCATNRDLLRGRLVGMDETAVQFASGYAEVSLPRSKVGALVWLQPPDPIEVPSATDTSASAASPSEEPSAESAKTESPTNSIQLWLRDGSLFVVDDVRMDGESLSATHPDLDQLTIPLDELWKVERQDADPSSQATIADWQLELTKEPQLVSGTDQGTESPLIGQDVSDLVLSMLEADDLRIGDHSEQVIILDFWASWCAPCVKSLPKLQAIAATFPTDRARLIGVNQAEAPFTVQTFLAHKDLQLDVAMDANGDIAKRFAVNSIPQTVVIANGKIQRVFLGTPPSLYTNLVDSINSLMQPTD